MSSFPPNVAQSPVRNVYMPLPPGVFPGGAMAVPARFPQGFPVHADINAINRPAMGQSTPPAQPASAQQGGSVWPWVIGGALGLGALYYGYQWMTKPKAEEAAEKIGEELSEAAGTDATKGGATLAKDAAVDATESLSEAGSKLANSAEEAVGSVEKKVTEVVEKGVKEAPGMMSRIGNALSHKAVLIPASLAAAAAAEYAYPVARPLVRAYGPVAMEYAGKSPELLGKLFQGARQTLGNAAMNFRYSGADLCKVPATAKSTLETLSQAASQAATGVCKPGEEPLTYLAGQKATSLWNWGAASLSALAARTGFSGSTVVKESAEKLGQSAMNGTANAFESVGAEKLGQCGLNDAPFLHGVQQKFDTFSGYVGDIYNKGVGQAKTIFDNAVLGSAASRESQQEYAEYGAKKAWISSRNALKGLSGGVKNPVCPVPVVTQAAKI